MYVQMAEVVHTIFHPSSFSTTVYFLAVVGLGCQQSLFSTGLNVKQKKDKCNMATIQYIVIPALFLAKNTFQAHWGQGIKVTFLLRALRVF